MAEVLFRTDGKHYVPTALAGSPWHPAVLHGGAPAGLLAHCLESQVLAANMQPARLSIDLLRPVPKAPLNISVRPIRSGNRIMLLEGSLEAGGNLVALATALFVKAEPVSLPEYAPVYTGKLSDPEGIGSVSFQDVLFGQSGNMPPGLHTAVELRPASELKETGKGSAWIALPLKIVEGQVNSPFMLAALAADFGNGVGQLKLGENTGTINADVQLQLSRLPKGEWIGLDSEAFMDESGVGQVLTVMHDVHGRIGQVSQTILPMMGFGGTN